MVKLLLVVTGSVALILGSVGAARAVGECPAGDPNLVCVDTADDGSSTSVKAGADGASADRTTWSGTAGDDYLEESDGVVIDGSGVTVYASEYESKSDGTNDTTQRRRVGADGYHERYEYASPAYGEYGRDDRSLDTDGFESREQYGPDDNPHYINRTYIDTNPDGGIGAGSTYDDEYGCYDHKTAGYDPVSNPTALWVENGSGQHGGNGEYC